MTRLNRLCPFDFIFHEMPLVKRIAALIQNIHCQVDSKNLHKQFS